MNKLSSISNTQNTSKAFGLFNLVNRIALCFVLFCTFPANAEIYQFKEGEKLKIKISKAGLNRISNPPYKIVQVTGDDSKFRLKYDDDGTNIYFMPTIPVGDSCEISIKNNAGFVQDVELIVSNIKGRSVIIDSKTTSKLENLQLSNISEMLRAMRDDAEDRFYVQIKRQKLDNLDSLKVTQEKIYKYKNLVGGVFEIKNTTRKEVTLNLAEFTNRFDNVKASYSNIPPIPPRKIATVLIVQKMGDK